jgi:hypothetical protein
MAETVGEPSLDRTMRSARVVVIQARPKASQQFQRIAHHDHGRAGRRGNVATIGDPRVCAEELTGGLGLKPAVKHRERVEHPATVQVPEGGQIRCGVDQPSLLGEQAPCLEETGEPRCERARAIPACVGSVCRGRRRHRRIINIGDAAQTSGWGLGSPLEQPAYIRLCGVHLRATSARFARGQTGRNKQPRLDAQSVAEIAQ